MTEAFTDKIIYFVWYLSRVPQGTKFLNAVAVVNITSPTCFYSEVNHPIEKDFSLIPKYKIK